MSASRWSEGLPAEDRARSPFTGFVRAHWEAVADRLLAGVRPYAGDGGATYDLPGPHASAHGGAMDGLEGYARTFLLAAFRLSGALGSAPGDLASRYGEGLAAGVGAAGPQRWPRIEPHSQAIVEAASIAIALAETRPWIWEALDDGTRERVAGWLGAVRVRDCWPTNWHLFPVVVHAFLKSVGAPYRQHEIDEGLEVLDRYHLGSGWYSDGPRGACDHYCGWAFHYYAAAWCRLGGDADDPVRAAAIRERLGAFLADYRLLVGGGGRPLLLGRSLVYRFATAAAFWAGAALDASPLRAGETRRAASGMLRHFLEHDAVRDGRLTLGWHDEFPLLAQAYSGPASPYWAAKGFLGLALPSDHPVWTEREEPLAVERADVEAFLEEPGWLVSGTRADGIVRVANGRRDRRPHYGGRPLGLLYEKLAFSTHAAPLLGAAAAELDLDAQARPADSPAGAAPAVRFRPAARPADGVSSQAVARAGLLPARRRRLRTVTALRGAVEVRAHRPSGPPGPVVRDGSHALAGREPPVLEEGDGWAAVRAGGLTSAALALVGFERAAVHRAEAESALGRFAAAPFLVGPWQARVLVGLHVITGEPLDVAELRAGTRVEVEGRRVRVTLPGHEPLELEP